MKRHGLQNGRIAKVQRWSDKKSKQVEKKTPLSPDVQSTSNTCDMDSLSNFACDAKGGDVQSTLSTCEEGDVDSVSKFACAAKGGDVQSTSNTCEAAVDSLSNDACDGKGAVFATFLNKPAAKSFSYSDENNNVYCRKTKQQSNSLEMTEIGEQLKKKYADLKPAVVPGHQKKDDGTWVRVFVVYSPDVMRATDKPDGIGLVMIRNPYQVDSEAKTVSGSKDVRCPISKIDHERATRAIETHSKSLWCNHSNLNIISVCSVRSKQKGAVLEKGVCVVLYCSTKGVVPLGEVEFPSRLDLGEEDYIDIDIREGYFKYGGYETKPSACRHDELKMGCSIGAITTQIGGTLGPFVQYSDTRSFLTCAHVFFDVGQVKKVDYIDDESHRINVVQPADDASCPDVTPCGFVQRAIFDPSMNPSIDVAVVTISDSTRQPSKGRFANDQKYKYEEAGFGELPEYNNGLNVQDFQSHGTSNMVVKFGSQTHLTTGLLVVDGVQVRPLSANVGLPSSEYIMMKNQYEVQGIASNVSFVQPGDSGSAVFMLNGTELHCIGMVIGCMSNGNAIVTPISPLLDALRVKVDISVFP